MTQKLEIIVASPPDREQLVAEMFFDHMLWAEINQEAGHLEVEFYPRSDGEPWRIPLATVIEALSSAKSKLIG